MSAVKESDSSTLLFMLPRGKFLRCCSDSLIFDFAEQPFAYPVSGLEYYIIEQNLSSKGRCAASFKNSLLQSATFRNISVLYFAQSHRQDSTCICVSYIDLGSYEVNLSSLTKHC